MGFLYKNVKDQKQKQYITKFMKKFKIAICISGQSRTWDYCKNNILNFYNITNFNDTEVDVDYFFHTWDINSYRDHVKGTTHYSEYKDEPFTAGDELIDFFKPKVAEVESYSTFIQKRNKLYPRQHLTVWEPMYHSIKKSINFKRQYEIDNDFEYDLVIKTRFDCIYDPSSKFLPHVPESLKAYSSIPVGRIVNEFNAPNFDEAVFFGESRTMDLLALTGDLHMLNRINKKDSLINEFDILPELFYGPGALIYKHMTDMNIYPGHHFTPFNYFVARLHVVNSGLDPINSNDWPHIVESCRDWYR